MKVKLDENMPTGVVSLLRARGHDVDTVQDEGRCGEPDSAIAAATVEAGRMLITLDRGFPVALPFGHLGVVVLRLADQSIPAVDAAMSQLLDHHPLDSLQGCVVVVSPGRIRVRRPQL